MPLYTLRNDVHGTEAMIAMNSAGVLKTHQIESIRRRLCGIEECDCGGLLKESGPQICPVRLDRYGKIKLGPQTKPI